MRSNTVQAASSSDFSTGSSRVIVTGPSPTCQLTVALPSPALRAHRRPGGLMYFAALAWLSFEGIQGHGGLQLMTVGQRTQSSQGALARGLRLVPNTGRIRVDDAAR